MSTWFRRALPVALLVLACNDSNYKSVTAAPPPSPAPAPPPTPPPLSEVVGVWSGQLTEYFDPYDSGLCSWSPQGYIPPTIDVTFTVQRSEDRVFGSISTGRRRQLCSFEGTFVPTVSRRPAFRFSLVDAQTPLQVTCHDGEFRALHIESGGGSLALGETGLLTGSASFRVHRVTSGGRVLGSGTFDVLVSLTRQ